MKVQCIRNISFQSAGTLHFESYLCHALIESDGGDCLTIFEDTLEGQISNFENVYDGKGAKGNRVRKGVELALSGINQLDAIHNSFSKPVSNHTEFIIRISKMCSKQILSFCPFILLSL